MSERVSERGWVSECVCVCACMRESESMSRCEGE